MKSIFISVFYLFAFSFLEAQQPFFKHYADEDGLPTNEIFDIFQDSKGYIWLGTANGLCRYDGYEFIAYANAEQNGHSVSDIFEDRKGRIWCHTFFGQIFFVESDSLKLLRSYKNKSSLAYAYDEARQRLYCGENDSLLDYDLVNDRAAFHRLPQELMGQDTMQIFFRCMMVGSRAYFSNPVSGFFAFDGSHFARLKDILWCSEKI